MNELSKNLMCIVLINGIELWVEKERIDTLMQVINNSKENKIIEFDGQFISTSSVSGIFTSQIMEERTRRKNGQWKCNKGVWHERKEQCECLSDIQIQIKEEYEKNYRKDYGVKPLN